MSVYGDRHACNLLPLLTSAKMCIHTWYTLSTDVSSHILHHFAVTMLKPHDNQLIWLQLLQART